MHDSLVKPFIKWAGGKQQLLPALMSLVPGNYGRYIDPFLGGGALFYALRPKSAILSDVNDELINLYSVVRDSPSSLINSVSKFRNDRETFYALRDKDPDRLSAVQKASRFLYLNKTCYNGLYRVNQSGKFNVPFAGYKNRSTYDAKSIMACSRLLKSADIESADFREMLQKNARKGDFVFLDPPYLPISQNANFIRYTTNPFSIADHIELARIASSLVKKGCFVVHTNSDHPLVYELYKDFIIQVAGAKRSINCNGEKRSGKDLIVYSGNLHKVLLKEEK